MWVAVARADRVACRRPMPTDPRVVPTRWLKCGSRYGIDPVSWTPNRWRDQAPDREPHAEPHATYPPEFKVEAVRVAHQSGHPIRQVARDLGISNETLRLWIRQTAIDHGGAPASAMNANGLARLAQIARSRSQRSARPSPSSSSPNASSRNGEGTAGRRAASASVARGSTRRTPGDAPPRRRGSGPRRC